MLDAVDKAYKTYNEGRLASILQPVVRTWSRTIRGCRPTRTCDITRDSRGSTGSSLSCAATSCLTQACAGSAPDRRI